MAQAELDDRIKFLLVGVEVLFVYIFGLVRLATMEWLSLFAWMGLLLWSFVHVMIVSAFILSFRLRFTDAVLYIAVHLFFLLAWLLPLDFASNRTWIVFEKFPFIRGLEPFLIEWGSTPFLTMATATLVCYAVIFILVIVRIVQFLVSLNKDAQAA
ncbi:MAG: hypothetical protein WHS83_03365 [Chloroflexus sp.]|uniref:hypothetical protein n=1 Tax=Chloroflexus sp. TaxID=1904827 RepID=UPI0030B19937